MENNFLEVVARSLNVELPERSTMDDYLDLIIPEIRQWGEDLNETKFYVQKGGKPWMEIRDEANFTSTILHFFNEGGEYLRSTNGDIIRGKWRLLENTNKMIIEAAGGGKDKGGSELYELAYLDNAFFILKKHGQQNRKRRYFAMGYEYAVKGLEWKDYIELLFNTYRSKHSNYRSVIIIIMVVIVIIVLLSIF
ncbi:MAG: hypothetical protein AAGH79_10635 [Bacteroidota bacterium]